MRRRARIQRFHLARQPGQFARDACVEARGFQQRKQFQRAFAAADARELFAEMRRVRRGAAKSAEPRLRPQVHRGRFVEQIIFFAAVKAVDALRQIQRFGVGAKARAGLKNQRAPRQPAQKTLQYRAHLGERDRAAAPPPLARKILNARERLAAGVEALFVVDVHRAQQPQLGALAAEQRERARRVRGELVSHFRIGFADDAGPVQREPLLVVRQFCQRARRALGGAAA